MIGVCIVFGIILGILITIIKKVGVIIFNCSFGYGVSVFIYNNFTSHIKTDPEHVFYFN